MGADRYTQMVTNMPTIDMIEYDPQTLEKMSDSALLLQLIARKDLERPNRESDLNTRQLRRELCEKARAFVAAFGKLANPDMVSEMNGIIDKYDVIVEVI